MRKTRYFIDKKGGWKIPANLSRRQAQAHAEWFLRKGMVEVGKKEYDEFVKLLKNKMKCPNCNYQINLISVAEFAQRVGCHRRTIENRILSGELECVDTSLGRMIPAELVKSFKRKRGAKKSV